MAETLADIPMEMVWDAQQGAVMRLQLYLLGETHRILGEFSATARGILLTAADEDDGSIDGLGLNIALSSLNSAWSDSFDEWMTIFQALRWEATRIPFGSLAVMHNAMVASRFEESRRLHEQEEAQVAFEEQIAAIIQAANQRVYGDGLQLSERVWNLNQNTWQQIQAIIYNGVADQDSAWNMANALEGLLGFGQECPRWTRTRLYRLTKQEIADGDRRGLYSGDECAGQGVAYKALRLARNEIQAVHHGATDVIMGRMPWVEQERIHLSPDHPDIGCECEDIVIGGDDANGVYPKGTILLPVHVQCLCYKTAEVMDEDAFVTQLNGWVNGTTTWSAMDQYANWLGVDQLGMTTVNILTAAAAQALEIWLWGEEDELTDAVSEARQLPLM